MSRKYLYLVVVLAMLAALVTMACHADCSPGYWKNHTEVWDERCDEDGYFCPDQDYNETMTYLEALQGGKDTRFSRFEVSGWLNANYPDAPCQD